MKRMTFIGVSIILILLIGACKKDEGEMQPDNNNNNDIEQPNQTVNEENNNNDDAKEANEEFIDPNVFITGEVYVGDDEIIVKGESNAPEGTRIHSSGITLTSGWQNMNFIEQAKVKEDGTFELTFPSVGLYTNVTLSLSNNDKTNDTYGEHMENVTGSQKYMTNDKNKFEVKTEFLLYPFREKPYTISLDIPDWDKPNDYGDNDIWMEVDYTTDHFFIIFEGKSNLVEGTMLGGNIYNSKDLIEPFSHDFTYVNPDGSFTLRVPYHSLKSGLYLPIYVKPSDNSWDNPLEHYGVQGEHFEGDLVKENDEERYIKYIVELAGSEFEISEDIDVTQDGEEIKIQVPDDLLFDFDKSDLKEEAKVTLDQIIEDLESLEDQTEIEINGHTDNEGEPDYNVTLSKERAQSVLNYINENGMVEHIEIIVNGYGEEKPIASNDEEEGRAKNRRVELVIHPEK